MMWRLPASPYSHWPIGRDHPDRRAAGAERRVDPIANPTAQRHGHREAHVHRAVHRTELDFRVVVLGNPQVGRAVARLGVEPRSFPARAHQLDRERTVLRPRVHVSAYARERQRSVLRGEIHASGDVFHRQWAVVRLEGQVRAAWDHHDEAHAPVLIAPKWPAAANGPHRAIRYFDLDLARDRLGGPARARAHLNPSRYRDAVAIPPDDLHAAVHAGIDRQRPPRGLHSRFTDFAVPRARAPVLPIPTVVEPFVVTFLRECGGGDDQYESGSGNSADHRRAPEQRGCLSSTLPTV